MVAQIMQSFVCQFTDLEFSSEKDWNLLDSLKQWQKCFPFKKYPVAAVLRGKGGSEDTV